MSLFYPSNNYKRDNNVCKFILSDDIETSIFCTCPTESDIDSWTSLAHYMDKVIIFISHIHEDHWSLETLKKLPKNFLKS